MIGEETHQAAAPTAPEAGPQVSGQGGILDRPEVQQAGWVWGDTGAQPPVDAPLPALVSVAVRLVGAFIGCTAQGTGMSPAGLGVMRLLAARDGLKKVIEAISLIGPRLQDAFGYVDPADEPVIRKFLAETIDRFGTLIREERGQ